MNEDWGSDSQFELKRRIEALEKDLGEVLPWAYKALEENSDYSQEAEKIKKRLEEGYFGVMERESAVRKKDQITREIEKNKRKNQKLNNSITSRRRTGYDEIHATKEKT